MTTNHSRINRWARIVILKIGFTNCYLYGASDTPEQVYFRTKAPIHVLGDVHADLDAFIASLRLKKLVDSQGHWIARGESLVQLGDLVDRGSSSMATLLYAMQLEKEIIEQGGYAFFLLGNHDMYAMQGLLDYMTTSDAAQFKSVIDDRMAFKEFKANRLDIDSRKIAATFVLNHTEPFKSWNRKRKAVVVINDNIFMHAGPNVKMTEYEIKNDINEEVQDWVRYYQELGGDSPVRKPPRASEWLLNSRGPLETRKLISESASASAEIKTVYRSFKVKRGFYGHNVTVESRPEVMLDGAVYLVDTGMSESYGGPVSVLTIDKSNTISSLQGKRPAISLVAERVRVKQLCLDLF